MCIRDSPQPVPLASGILRARSVWQAKTVPETVGSRLGEGGLEGGPPWWGGHMVNPRALPPCPPRRSSTSGGRESKPYTRHAATRTVGGRGTDSCLPDPRDEIEAQPSCFASGRGAASQDVCAVPKNSPRPRRMTCALTMTFWLLCLAIPSHSILPLEDITGLGILRLPTRR